MGQLMNLAFGLAPVDVAEGPWIPLADVSETDDAYVVEVDLPGVNRDQIDIQLQDRELVITGEIPESEQKGRRHRRTRRTGRFEFRHLPARRRQRRRRQRATLRRGTDGDRSEVRGGQAASHRDQGLTSPARLSHCSGPWSRKHRGPRL